MSERVLLSWSSGKDSAWALHTLRQDDRFEVCGLFTTLNGENDRVAMHGVRARLLAMQAEAVGLPLIQVALPQPCSNEEYEARTNAALKAARDEHGITGVAFGDLYLEDVRAYRERQAESSGLASHFPLWGTDTRELVRAMIDGGQRAILTCVDPRQVPASFAGRWLDDELLRDFPDGADPCGENGEFHTLTVASPTFRAPLAVERGEVVERGGFVFADVLPVD